MELALKLAITALVLAFANVLYQAFTSHDWSAAVERSFLQAAALFAAWIAIR